MTTRGHHGIIFEEGGGGGGGAWVPQWAVTLDRNEFSWGGYTMRSVLPALAQSGTKIRLTVGGFSPSAWDVLAMYVGKKAASGDYYDFAATPQHALLSGSGTFSGTTTDVLLDELTGTYTAGDQLVVAVAFNSPSSIGRSNSTAPANSIFYVAGNDAATVNAGVYTPNNTGFGLIKQLDLWVP